MLLAERVTARNREAVRSDPVSMEEFGVLLGASTGSQTKSRSGTMVSAKRALGISAWYSGVMHISTVVAGLPIHRYRAVGDEREQVATPSWMVRPDLEQPWYGIVEFWMMSLLHKGNAYAAKIRNPAGQVVGLREIHPDRVTAGQAPDGSKRFVIDRDERLWSTREILHIPGLTYDGRFGINPIATAADVLGTAAATDEYAARFFGNNTNLGGIISVQEAMTPTEAQALQGEWEAFHAGILNAHRTGVLSKGAKYDRVTLNAEDTQLIQARQYGVTEISRLLRLPPHKLYDLTRSTNNNIEHQSIEAVQDCYQLWCERIESHVNFDLDLTPPGTFHEFNLDGRMRGDTATRYTALTQAVGGPWMEANRARKLERLPAVEGGDEVLRPLAMTTTSAAPDSSPRDIAEVVQKIYLGVTNGVIKDYEARQLLIELGFDIPLALPAGGAT